MPLTISVEDLLSEEMLHILQAHLDFCPATTPLEHVYALDASKLKAPDITVFGARLSGRLVGVGAIRILNQDHAELKSMHTLVHARGQGSGPDLTSYSFHMANEFLALSLDSPNIIANTNSKILMSMNYRFRNRIQASKNRVRIYVE